MEFLAVFLVIVGFAVGYGAVMVIDVHGFLGRTSPHWTETTIRAHRVTKPLIWVGIVLVLVGHILMTQTGMIVGWPMYLRFTIIIALVINGSFLSFVVSPELIRREREGFAKELLPPPLQRKIAASFVISIIGWWGLMALVAWQFSSLI